MSAQLPLPEHPTRTDVMQWAERLEEINKRLKGQSEANALPIYDLGYALQQATFRVWGDEFAEVARCYHLVRDRWFRDGMPDDHAPSL